MAELMLGQPLFPGESGIDQLVEIIKVLGTPTREQIRTMNPNYMEHKFPQIKPHPFNKVSNRCPAHRSNHWLCFLRSSARHQPTPLTWYRHYSSIHLHNVSQPSKQCAILFSMSSVIPCVVSPTLAIPTALQRSCQNFSIFQSTVGRPGLFAATTLTVK